VPTYEYRCKNGHQFEVIQSMSDDPIAVCQVCGAPVERVFHPVAVHFKGSGFYTTDYGKNRSAASGSDSDSKKESKESKEPAKSESSTSSPSDSKSDSKNGSSSSD
jgi:putative FmdB family regulatory protein